MTVNPSGWRPSAPANQQGEAQTATGNRALMLEEPLLFEIGGVDQTGVDFDELPKSKTRLGTLERSPPIGPPGPSAPEPLPPAPPRRPQGARTRPPLPPTVAAELRDRSRAVPARLVHHEA